MPCIGMRGIGPWKRRKNSLSGLSSSSSPAAACAGAFFVAVILTTAPLFASTTAAKSGSVCIDGAPLATAVGDGAVAPLADWLLTLAAGPVGVTGSFEQAASAAINEMSRK